MKLPEITAKVTDEFLKRLERQGKTDEYIDGVLEGMSFVLEFYASMLQLHRRQKELMKEEYSVTA